jgi:hypothetical protein
LHNLVARRERGSFPTIGKYFSNGWKNWRGFSNDWKTVSGGFLETKMTKWETKEEDDKCQAMMTISDILLRRQLEQPGTTFSRVPGGQRRPAGRRGEACRWLG